MFDFEENENLYAKTKIIGVGDFGRYGKCNKFNEAGIILQKSANPDAEIVWGVTVDENCFDFAEVLIIATDL